VSAPHAVSGPLEEHQMVMFFGEMLIYSENMNVSPSYHILYYLWYFLAGKNALYLV
jgi:hypothetical protein